MNSIQGELAPIMVSSDGGITWKTIVCLETANIPLATTVNEVETNCGVGVGLGAIKFNPAGSAVCEATPTSAQVTYKDMVQWQVNKTLIMFKVEYPGSGGTYGQNLALSGTCYVTATDVTTQTGQLIKFTFTLTGTGTVNTNPIP